MILIADAHIEDGSENQAEFFRMLAAIQRTDQDVVFLGDIFELWIGFARYEKPCHKLFLNWCREQKKHRGIVFLEGNHEYFVARERRAFFTVCFDDGAWQDDQGNLFCHGDQINRQDKNYLRFRRAVKNNLTGIILRFLPGGPALGLILKRLLKKTNHEFRKHLPEKALLNFAAAKLQGAPKIVFVGHFHQTYTNTTTGGGRVHIVPGWFQEGGITCFEPESGYIETLPWRVLLASPSLKKSEKK